jgi:hypothetical protein
VRFFGEGRHVEREAGNYFLGRAGEANENHRRKEEETE